MRHAVYVIPRKTNPCATKSTLQSSATEKHERSLKTLIVIDISEHGIVRVAKLPEVTGHLLRAAQRASFHPGQWPEGNWSRTLLNQISNEVIFTPARRCNRNGINLFLTEPTSSSNGFVRRSDRTSCNYLAPFPRETMSEIRRRLRCAICPDFKRAGNRANANARDE
jgi:hypothetical protein